MELNEFQRACHATNNYSDEAINRGALFAGLTGEAGEASEQYKKMLRDDNCTWNQQRREKAALEVMDCAWYCVETLWSLGYTFEEAANMLLAKLSRRAIDNKIHGEGSDR